jgi:hypothetical protein
MHVHHFESMITYIRIMFSSEGKRPSLVFDAIRNLGFEPTTGNYDGIYKWDKKATLDEAIYLADKVQMTLKGMGVVFTLETVADQDNGCD